MKRVLRHSGRGLLHLLDLLWVSGALMACLAWWIGWIFKDANRFTLWLSFIPPLGIILFGFGWLFLTLRHRFRVAQLFVFLTILVCFVKVLLIDHRWNRPPERLPSDNLRILHWNTAWGVLGVESIVRTMSFDRPDLVLISEPPRLDMISDIAYHALGMEHIFTDRGMTLASHYPITHLGSVPFPLGAAWHVLVETPHGPLEFVAADLVSRPDLNRHPPLQALADWIASRTNTWPLVMMGDFNTPHDATAFAPLRQHLQRAYEVRGRGWPYTWPVPLPVFAIDHTWITPDITVNDYFLLVARYSDHKRQIIDLSLPPRNPDAKTVADPAP
jgi:vancomycin resistance protein VanJ